MAHTTTSLELASSAGPLSATLMAPDNVVCSLLLAHGAGADHKHAHMESLAQAFARVGIATLRFNFPFKQQGRNRVDSKDLSVACICDASRVLAEKVSQPMFVGGHSFGGRMATHAAVEDLSGCAGLILCSFPLHPAGKPGTDRVEHFKDLSLPMLFLNGNRDALSDTALLENTVSELNASGGGNNQLHWLDTADHSYKILKRKRVGVDVYDEAAEVAAAFVKQNIE